MIHHYSIPVQETKHVAEVFADLFSGSITPFGPYENSYIVWFGDEYGSAIEFYPLGTEMLPGAAGEQTDFQHNASHSRYSATHAAISIKRTREDIFKIAKRHGWRAVELSRGGFNVIEFWIENSIMIELLTVDMSNDYLALTKRFIKPN